MPLCFLKEHKQLLKLSKQQITSNMLTLPWCGNLATRLLLSTFMTDFSNFPSIELGLLGNMNI